MLRPGLSLAEVLVATVLLTLGVGGAVSTLGASARLNARARALELVVQSAEDRLAWLDGAGCATGDTAIVSTAPVVERWELFGVSGGRAFVGTVTAELGAARPIRFTLETRLPCP